jgi:hypothetical protein
MSGDAPAAEDTRTQQPKSQAMEQAKAFIAGGFGGASAVLVGSWWPFFFRFLRLAREPK